MATIQINNYNHNASANEIEFTDYTDIVLDNILKVSNKTKNLVMYDATDSNLSGSVADNVLTYDYTNIIISSDDKLEILYEDTIYDTEYIILSTDIGRYIRLSDAIGVEVTIPLDNNMPTGSMIALEQTGEGNITIVAEVGVNLNGNILSNGQFTILVLIKTTANTWTCIGGTE